MTKSIHSLLLTLLAMFAVSCGTDNEFRVNGRIDGFGTGNLRLVYYNGEGVQSLAATAIDGRFTVTGRLDKEALLRVYTNNGHVAGRLIVAPGQTIEAVYNITDPAKVELDGNDNSKRLAKFIRENADAIRSGDAATLNTAVENYVRANPKRAVSGALLADYYDPQTNPALALELINTLERDARNPAALDGLRDMLMSVSQPVDSIKLEPLRLFGRGDTLSDINPAEAPLTLIAITDASAREADSVVNAIKAIADTRGAGIRIADISCDPDTAAWKRSLTRPESDTDADKEINRYWSPAAFCIPQLQQIPVQRVPWFILADSTGTILYRGSSASQARKAATGR